MKIRSPSVLGGFWPTAGGLSLILGALDGANLPSGSCFGSPRGPKCSPKGPSWRLRGRILGSILGRFFDICASFFRHPFRHPFLCVVARFRTNFASIWGSILCDFA